ncbi:hypothetical protein Ahy_A05g022226 [Arachis hypogaea]|uniref:MULE transposase domain-containing protein n=1 Tax=Arachis hypogaea TaxID=3818 RepID=A0A445D047_ARAHY|nr:hypothetical protein Ahy_A05g022226 [Arachis hypogaea]
MNDKIVLKKYYFGQILLQIYEGVKFVCKNPVDITIPFIISFEKLKGVICKKIDFEISRRISCILYKYLILVFNGFIQFQTKYVTNEASMQEIFSISIESHYNSDNEEEFESNYEIVGPDGDEDQVDGIIEANVTEVTNALANQHPFEESSFMRALDLEAMHAPEFSKYMNAVEILIMADSEFTVKMEFSFREAVIIMMKDYTIHRGVDYRVYESKLLTFYAKCTQYGLGYDWLIRISMICRKYCWVIRRYNDSHTCTRATISQNHSKFNYTISYRKLWLAKQKSMKKIFEGWKASYKTLPMWFEAMCHKEPSTVVHFETMPAYQGDELVTDIRVLHRVFWSYYPCIRAFRYCKPIVQVDGTHLFRKYKGCLLVTVSPDSNNNIVPIAFAIVDGETSDALHFFS